MSIQPFLILTRLLIHFTISLNINHHHHPQVDKVTAQISQKTLLLMFIIITTSIIIIITIIIPRWTKQHLKLARQLIIITTSIIIIITHTNIIINIMPKVDKVTAQISQRTLLLILPLVFASFVTGTVAVFEQVGVFVTILILLKMMMMRIMMGMGRMMIGKI